MLLVALLTSAACSPVEPSPPLIPVPSLAAPTSAELEAIRFRTDFSLRSDLAYVRAVAIDPRASTQFGVPLLPEEIAELNARSANADAVRDVVTAEADAHPEDYCGRYIDNANFGALTTTWRANLEAHAAAIRAKVGPAARLAFRPCRFTQAELDDLMDKLNAADSSWLSTIPAALVDSWRDD